MIFSALVDERRVKVDLDPIPKSLFELNESLEKLYPDHINYTEWPSMGAPMGGFHRYDGPKYPLRYFATYSSDRVNNRNILKQDLQLWQLDTNLSRSNGNAPASPTLLELGPAALPKLLSAKKLAVSLPDDEKTIKHVDFNRRTTAYDVICAAVKGTPFSPDEMTMSDGDGRQFCPKDSLVVDYRVFPGSSLFVNKKEKAAGPSFGVHVKTLAGKTFDLVVNSGLDIHDLKVQIESSQGIFSDQQRLIYENRLLQDHLSVGYYNIGKDATLHLVLKLRGGMLHQTSGRLDFTNMAVFEDSSTTGDIEIQVVLPDLSVMVMHMDENNYSFEKVTENLVKMIRQRANKRAAEELVAVDVDAETDVVALRAMLRKAQQCMKEFGK